MSNFLISQRYRFTYKPNIKLGGGLGLHWKSMEGSIELNKMGGSGEDWGFIGNDFLDFFVADGKLKSGFPVLWISVFPISKLFCRGVIHNCVFRLLCLNLDNIYFCGC